MSSKPQEDMKNLLRAQDYYEAPKYYRKNFYSLAFGTTFVAFARTTNGKYRGCEIDKGTMEALWFGILDTKYAKWSGDGRTKDEMVALLEKAKYQVYSEKADKYWVEMSKKFNDKGMEEFGHLSGVDLDSLAKEAEEDEERAYQAAWEAKKTNEANKAKKAKKAKKANKISK